MSYVPAWQTFSAIDDTGRAIPSVEFRNVTFSYDDHKVLDDLSFKLMKGETLIVLSSSGGGKSTILKLALGLSKPDEGRILIDGEEITDYDEEKLNRVRQKIGMDFQDGALFDSLSVYDNVAFRCHENGVPEDRVEQEVRSLLRFVNLEDAIDMMPAELSGGMRIRVGIARALVGNPHILLLDEPTAGLDPPTARAICELVVKLRDMKDVSTIFVTHEIDNVHLLASTYACLNNAGEIIFLKEDGRLCLINTKIMMLRKGRVIFSGTDEELFGSEDPYIREFIGT
ncbi:MAG TPA: ATP-binding cassette domain-containing protein [Pyrinomonadaceae bacterium]|nr:ATP-binding cassette domain-containing protein [Pyrinomonadaceae bacterium]